MIHICKLGFSSQEKLRSYIKELLIRIGENSSVKATEYYQFLYEFCSRHPDKNKMIGVIDIRIVSEYDHYRLYLVKAEGVNPTVEDISIKKCISGRDNTPNENFNLALRLSVLPQIIAFKQTADLSRCVLCKIAFSEAGKVIHIDHFKPQFHTIVSQFKEKFNPILPVEYLKGQNGYLGFVGDDKLTEKEFVLYHATVATFRVLCKDCNCSRSLDD